MIIKSVNLTNYKSIGNYDESKIILEPTITAIVGKNESGKSNILDGMSQIDLCKKNLKAFNKEKKNRIFSSEGDLSYTVILTKGRKDNLEILTDTEVFITESEMEVTGGIYDYFYLNIHPYLKKTLEFLKEYGNNPLALLTTDYEIYAKYPKCIENDSKLNIYEINRLLALFKEKNESITNEEIKKELTNLLNEVEDKWIKLKKDLPVFFFMTENSKLQYSYSYEEVQKELVYKQKKSLLSDLVELINIKPEMFYDASKPGSNSVQISNRFRISKNIENYINKPFQKFYTTEKIALNISFNDGRINFIVQSNEGETFQMSERSTGLRWYLELFINVQAKKYDSSNIVYLLDEPGTELHVNAQKELLKLFKHLTENSNQVVYTTHSPYMLDVAEDGIEKIRAVKKDDEGYSRIYKNVYDSRIATDFQQDTLAPVLHAIGMSLNNTFGPAQNKLNIVTEGVSDYIYINMMLDVLGYDRTKFVIIPSNGAENSINILSILMGWGCPAIAVFDYDYEGIKCGRKMISNELFEYKKDFLYLKDVENIDFSQKILEEDSIEIEDMITREEIEKFKTYKSMSSEISKTLVAKLMSQEVKIGDYKLGERCKSNFKELFQRILTYKQI